MTASSSGSGEVREILWQEVFPWLTLIRALRLALSVRVLLLAALALIVLSFGWQVLGAAFSGTSDEALRQAIGRYSTWPWQTATTMVDESWRSGNDPQPLPPGAPHPTAVPIVGQWLGRGPIAHFWHRVYGPFAALFALELSVESLAYYLLGCLWTIAVWSLFGGAITRTAALVLAREETLGLKASVRYAAGKWTAYFLSPLLPLLGVLLAAVPLAVLGFCMRLGFFAALAGLLWPLVLLGGLFLTIVMVGLGLGWPFLLPTISSEGTDAFDALSRSYAYVYQRPLHLLFYTLVATVLGLLGAWVVDLFAGGVVNLGAWGVSWGEGGAITDVVRQTSHLSGADRTARIAEAASDAGYDAMTTSGLRLIAFWTGLVSIVQTGFRAGFFWSAATAIYLLLRRSVDATEMDEVSVDDAEEEPVEGLPDLEAEPEGATEPADEPGDVQQ